MKEVDSITYCRDTPWLLGSMHMLSGVEDDMQDEYGNDMLLFIIDDITYEAIFGCDEHGSYLQSVSVTDKWCLEFEEKCPVKVTWFDDFGYDSDGNLIHDYDQMGYEFTSIKTGKPVLFIATALMYDKEHYSFEWFDEDNI